MLTSVQEITRVVQAAFGLGKLVIVDKSFQDFLLDSSEYTVRPLLADYSNLLILQSLTKLFCPAWSEVRLYVCLCKNNLGAYYMG